MLGVERGDRQPEARTQLHYAAIRQGKLSAKGSRKKRFFLCGKSTKGGGGLRGSPLRKKDFCS